MKSGIFNLTVFYFDIPIEIDWLFSQKLTSLMYLWVGLGNPGVKYENTRHNIGAIMLRELFSDSPLKMDKSLNSFLGTSSLGGKKNVLLIPQTFMNLSGDAVKKALKLFNIIPENMIILHDEIDMQPLQLCYKFGGGHRGHNGLRDIIAKISTPDFHRIRIGVGRPADPCKSVADYVLSVIPKQDIPDVNALISILKENALWK